MYRSLEHPQRVSRPPPFVAGLTAFTALHFKTYRPAEW